MDRCTSEWTGRAVDKRDGIIVESSCLVLSCLILSLRGHGQSYPGWFKLDGVGVGVGGRGVGLLIHSIYADRRATSASVYSVSRLRVVEYKNTNSLELTN